MKKRILSLLLCLVLCLSVLPTMAFAAGAHSVSINTPSNGTVTADKGQAEAGARITLTVTPSDGYFLNSLIVKDVTSNAEITVSQNSLGKYIFTMPDSRVTVTAEFYRGLVTTPNASYTVPVNGKVDVLFKTELGYRVDYGYILPQGGDRTEFSGVRSDSDRKVPIYYDGSKSGQTITYSYSLKPIQISNTAQTLPAITGTFQVTFAEGSSGFDATFPNENLTLTYGTTETFVGRIQPTSMTGDIIKEIDVATTWTNLTSGTNTIPMTVVFDSYYGTQRNLDHVDARIYAEVVYSNGESISSRRCDYFVQISEADWAAAKPGTYSATITHEAYTVLSGTTVHGSSITKQVNVTVVVPENTTPKIIESLNVNVTAPAVGSHPDYSPVITATPNEVTSLCKVYLTPAWICADTESDLYNGNGAVMTAADTFEAGKYYAFSIQVNTLDAIVAGWQRSSTITATINGAATDSMNHNVLVNTFGEDIGWLRAAWFLPNTANHRVTFSMNGHGTAPDSQEVGNGNRATRPNPDPTAEGWRFVDWYADATCSIPFDFTAGITRDTTVYAKWTEVTAPRIIESLNVNVTAPAVGNHPDFSPVITGTPSEAASLCKIYLTPEWICADTESDLYNGNGTVMTAADTFEAGKYYAFSIQVSTLDAIVAGWQRSSTIIATINGAATDSLNHKVLVNTFGEDIGWLRAAWFLTGTTSPTGPQLTLSVTSSPADGTPVTIGQHVSHYFTVTNTGSEPVQLDGIYKGGARILQYMDTTLAPGESHSWGQSGFDVAEANITQNAQGEKGVADSFYAAGSANGVAVNSNTVTDWHPLKTSDNPTPTPDKPNTPTNPPKDNLDNSPKTGDARQTVLWIGMLMVSFGTAAAAVQISRKKDQV